MSKPFSSPESKATLETIKTIILEYMPAGQIDAMALEVLGGTDEEVEHAVQRMVLGLVEQLKDGPLSPALKVVLPVAAGHIIRDRLNETRRVVSDKLGEIRGGGWA